MVCCLITRSLSRLEMSRSHKLLSAVCQSAVPQVGHCGSQSAGGIGLKYLLVLVVVGRGVQRELLLPHSRSELFLNVLTVLALTTLSDNLFQWRMTL